MSNKAYFIFSKACHIINFMHFPKAHMTIKMTEENYVN